MFGKIGQYYFFSEIYNNVKYWQYFVVDKLFLLINSSMMIILKIYRNKKNLRN